MKNDAFRVDVPSIETFLPSKIHSLASYPQLTPIDSHNAPIVSSTSACLDELALKALAATPALDNRDE
jgi:hypothetical protein